MTPRVALRSKVLKPRVMENCAPLAGGSPRRVSRIAVYQLAECCYPRGALVADIPDQRHGPILLEHSNYLAGCACIIEPVEGRRSTNELGSIIRDRSEERRVGKECRSRWSPY